MSCLRREEVVEDEKGDVQGAKERRPGQVQRRERAAGPAGEDVDHAVVLEGEGHGHQDWGRGGVRETGVWGRGRGRGGGGGSRTHNGRQQALGPSKPQAEPEQARRPGRRARAHLRTRRACRTPGGSRAGSPPSSPARPSRAARRRRAWRRPRGARRCPRRRSGGGGGGRVVVEGWRVGVEDGLQGLARWGCESLDWAVLGRAFPCPAPQRQARPQRAPTARPTHPQRQRHPHRADHDRLVLRQLAQLPQPRRRGARRLGRRADRGALDEVGQVGGEQHAWVGVGGGVVSGGGVSGGGEGALAQRRAAQGRGAAARPHPPSHRTPPPPPTHRRSRARPRPAPTRGSGSPAPRRSRRRAACTAGSAPRQ
jgi:hypothetical protein